MLFTIDKTNKHAAPGFVTGSSHLLFFRATSSRMQLGTFSKKKETVMVWMGDSLFK